VLAAASTKWNFLNFVPGLVGGHCIGVDPYYLTYKAEQMGYHSQIILAGRRINDDMGKYVTENIIKSLVRADIPIKNARIGILGFTFKEDCPDTRNTRVIDIIRELAEYGIVPLIVDPIADQFEACHEYGIEFVKMKELRDLDALVIAVAHTEFMYLSLADMDKMFKDVVNHRKVILDIKGILDRSEAEGLGFNYWRL